MKLTKVIEIEFPKEYKPKYEAKIEVIRFKRHVKGE